MAVICPAILAANEQQFKQQIDKVAAFAHRVQIDLTDRIFAPTPTVKPEESWWPVGFAADYHLMFKDPARAIETVAHHKPNLIIVHAEANGRFDEVADYCHSRGIKTGLALLQETPVESILPGLDYADHILIFSGDLGSYGGKADLAMLDKVRYLKTHRPELEVGWDGGVSDQNVAELVGAGVDVLNVGGYIQNSQDPARAFLSLQRIADETGTT